MVQTADVERYTSRVRPVLSEESPQTCAQSHLSKNFNIPPPIGAEKCCLRPTEFRSAHQMRKPREEEKSLLLSEFGIHQTVG